MERNFVVVFEFIILVWALDGFRLLSFNSLISLAGIVEQWFCCLIILNVVCTYPALLFVCLLNDKVDRLIELVEKTKRDLVKCGFFTDTDQTARVNTPPFEVFIAHNTLLRKNTEFVPFREVIYF